MMEKDVLTHLWTFCNEMFQLGKDEELFIHLFLESLEGHALRWFMNLERGKLWTWKDLSQVFLEHSKTNLDFLPLRLGLDMIRPEPYENIREYALRWRLIAYTCERPLEEVDMVSTLLETLGSTYEIMA